MSSSQRRGNDQRQQGAASRNLDFQRHSQRNSQFANSQPNSQFPNSQPNYSSANPQPTSQFSNLMARVSEPNFHSFNQQQSLPQHELPQTLSQFDHHQSLSQLLNSQQATFPLPTQPSSYFETPEVNAYDEQREHFHNTQSEYRTPERGVQGQRGRKGKNKEVVEVSHAEGYRKTWEEFEDIIFARCWCNKTDSTYDTKEAKYWGDITDMYNEDVTAAGGVKRDLKALQNRWHKQMGPQCTKYVAAYNKVMSKVRSGENQAKTLERVKKQYIAANPKNVAFQFEHVIDILMKCQKFCATGTTGSYPIMDNVDLEYLATPETDQYESKTPRSDQYSNQSSGKRKSTSESNTEDVDEVNSPAKSRRPEGVKKRKMKAKRRLEGVPEDNPEVEEARRLRSLEFEFENARLDHHVKSRKLKEHQTTLEMLRESIAEAETPEAKAFFKAQKQWYIMQWLQEVGAPGASGGPGAPSAP